MDVLEQYASGHRSHTDCKPQPLCPPYEQEDAIALAERKRVVNTPTVTPADPRNLREGARSSSPTICEYDSPLYSTDMPTGGLKGNLSRAVEAKTAHDTRCGAFVDGQNKPVRGVHGDSAHSPVSSYRGHGSRAGVAGTGGGSSAGRAVDGGRPGVACRRLKSQSQAAPNGRSTEEEEEENRLVASIARLDTLLREENGDADELNASQNNLGCSNPVPRGTGDVRRESRKARGEMERKPRRVPVGGISKLRVRGGSSKETKNCSSVEPVPSAVPKPGVNHGMPVKRVVPSTSAIGMASDGADATTSIGPGMFPPLFCQVQTGPADRGERGRYIVADASAGGENGLSREAATHVTHSRVASPLPYRCSTREGQRQVEQRDDGYIEVVHEHQYCENAGRDFTPACGGADINNRYGNGAIDPPRYTVRRENYCLQQSPRSQARHRDARYGDGPEGLHGDIGGARGYDVDRVAAIGSRDVWERQAGRRDLTRKLQPDEQPIALGHERGGSTGWDRCDAYHCAFQPSAESRNLCIYFSLCEGGSCETRIFFCLPRDFQNLCMNLAYPFTPGSKYMHLFKRLQSFSALLYFSSRPTRMPPNTFPRMLAGSLFRMRIKRYKFVSRRFWSRWWGEGLRIFKCEGCTLTRRTTSHNSLL